jgi:hypothetical protein
MNINKDVIKLLEKHDEDGEEYVGYILIGIGESSVRVAMDIKDPYQALGVVTKLQKQILLDTLED